MKFDLEKIKVKDIVLNGNHFWHTDDADVDLYADFNHQGRSFSLVETCHSTNGGANYTNLLIRSEDGEITIQDFSHDGGGAWQTGDSDDAFAEYRAENQALINFLREIAES